MEQHACPMGVYDFKADITRCDYDMETRMCYQGCNKVSPLESKTIWPIFASLPEYEAYKIGRRDRKVELVNWLREHNLDAPKDGGLFICPDGWEKLQRGDNESDVVALPRL